jgi:pimeloyl-ACP methyl ester carboxylesterase
MTSEPPTPRKITTYPICDDPKAGAVFFFGEADAPNLALLCAGFPADHELFLPFASRLASEANCLVGVTCLPGFDDREDHPYTANKIDGYSFEDMVAAMREAFKVLKAESTFSGTAKLTGIFHDWGTVPGCMFTNRAIEEKNSEICPDQIVLFDVLDFPIAPKDSPYQFVLSVLYRVVLAAAFALRLYVSKIVAQIFSVFAFPTVILLRLMPTKAIDSKVGELRKQPIGLDRMIYMSYPYYNIIKAMLAGKAEETLSGKSLPKDLTKTPVLYMYGLEKRIMFHEKLAVEVLENEAKEGRRSKAIAVEDAGHYLYLQQPDICMEEVKKFIEDA